MKTVILTAGPQGAGKSTYCEQVIKAHPDVQLLSRDKLLNELFGSAWLDPYSGGHYYAMEQLWQRIRTSLKQKAESFTLILDCWNGSPRERSLIVTKLREFGADEVVAWYFITPLEHCVRWFMDRECQDEDKKWGREQQEISCRYDFHLFHELATDLKQGLGFDCIKHINPTQLQLFPDIFPL
jgi:predicted kinase